MKIHPRTAIRPSLLTLLLTLSIISVIPGMLLAQKAPEEGWSLEECIGYAMEHNLQIKQRMLSLELAGENLLESRAAMLPSLNGNVSHGYNWGRTIDRFTNEFATERVQFNNFYLSSSVYVFNGFRLLNTIQKNRLELMASRYDVDKMRDDISLNIATAYLSILFSIEQLENIRGQVDVTRQQLARTRQLVDAGTLARGSLLTMEAQLAAEERQVVEAENLVDLNHLTLTQLLDLPSSEGFRIIRPDFAMEEGNALLENPNDIYAYALEHQPGVQSAEIRLEGASKDVSIAQSYRSPSLAIQGSWGTGYSGASRQLQSATLTGIDTLGYTIEPTPVPVGIPAFDYSYERIPFKDQIDQNNNTSLGIYLTIPIFNGFQARTAVNRARLNLMNAEYALEIEKNRLYKEIQQSYADAMAALKRYRASEKSKSALGESFTYTEQRFDVGMVNSVEYNDAKNKLSQAESEVLQAKYEFVFRKTILDYYLGKPITLR
jgi:outer membrane protein